MDDIAKLSDVEWYAEVPRSIRKQTLFGMFLLLVTFGGFGAWALSAPLAAAVIAQGRFVATGQNKVVQHFEGGIIEEILVNEGDKVALGQPLIRLDETPALARERELFLRQSRLELIAARLTAQIEGADAIRLPAQVEDNLDDPEIAPMLESQQKSFDAWLTKLKNESDLIEKNIAALEFRAEGYAKQLLATEMQVQMLEDELADKQALLKKGLVRSTDVLSIQRVIVEATGQIGRISAEIEETNIQIGKYQQQILQNRDLARQDSLEELETVQGELDSVREQSREAKNVLRRATINAPVSGTVIQLFYHTAGGVIESGKGIMEILPDDAPLIIETQIKRTEIDSVKIGQHATIRLVALNRRTTPVLDGTVFYISADALAGAGSVSGPDFYLARIRLSPSELALVRGFTPTPGMPIEALIQTSERTFFSYLTKPITDSMSRAFTEQ